MSSLKPKELVQKATHLERRRNLDHGNKTKMETNTNNVINKLKAYQICFTKTTKRAMRSSSYSVKNFSSQHD